MILRFSALLLLLVCLPVAAKIDVSLSGLSGAERDNVEQRLAILAAAGRSDLDAFQVERLHLQAEDDIRNALQPFGYYSPEIDASLSGSAPHWQASYRVQLGPPTTITRLDIALEGDGQDFPALQQVLTSLPLHRGQRLLHTDYETAKARLTEAAFSNGFLDAQFDSSELRIDPSTQSAEVTLHLKTGSRYFFGPISIEQDGLDPDLPRRYLTIAEGEPFDPQKLLKTQFALTDLGYFQTVEILPQRDRSVDRHIPIVIRATRRPFAKYQFGAGYGTDTGARLLAGTEFRQLNAAGHKFSTNLRLSEIKTDWTNEYRLPLGTIASDSLSFTGGIAYEKVATGDDSRYSVGASLNRTPGRWQRRIRLDFIHERTNLNQSPTSSNLLMPGINYTRGEYDDPIHTRRGWFAFFDVHGASTAVLSTASFVQVHTVLRGAYPLGDRLTLLGRAEIGASKVAELSTLPPSQRFFAGGDQSVRGYAYQSIGPRDATGAVVGGKYMGTFSIEPDIRLTENWSAALFYDLGGVDDKPTPKLYGGIGTGARYRAPIGEVRVDLAHPLTGDSHGLRLHIGVRVGL